MPASVSPEILDRPFAEMRPFLEFIRARGFSPAFAVDVGANRGRWTELFLEVFPRCKMLLIEPQPEMRSDLDALCARFPGASWVEVAAGARDETRLQTIWEDTEGSSFLPHPHPERQATGEQRPARVRRLDDLLRERGGAAPDLVKLDVQGFELEVLRGCPGLFGRTELFILESSLYSFLDDLPLLSEVVAFMSERGYELYDLAGRIRRPLDGALAQLDLVFARREGALRGGDRWS